MRRTLTLIFSLSLLARPGGNGFAQGLDTLVVSLADAERRAMESSPLLSGARAEVELSEAQRTQADNARYLPELSLQNLWGPIPRARGEFNEYGVLTSPDQAGEIGKLSWFTQAQLDIVQPLYGFGKISSRQDAAGHGVEVSEAGLEGARDQALLLVRQLYWGVVLTKELERVLDNVRENAAEAEEKLNEQYEEGDASQNDLFKFTLFEYEVNRRARELEAAGIEAREGLRAAMGLERGIEVDVDADRLEPLDVALDSLSAYLDLAQENRPELKQLRAGIMARESLRKAEERDAWPTLILAGGIRANYAPDRYKPKNPFLNNDFNYLRAGALVGFDWDVNFLHHRDETRIQRMEANKLQAQLQPLSGLVEKEVREAYLKARRALADVEEGEEALQASENWFRAEMQTFDIGIGQIKDVIDAFQANVEMETLQLQNIAAFNVALAELAQRVGMDVTGGASGVREASGGNAISLEEGNSPGLDR